MWRAFVARCKLRDWSWPVCVRTLSEWIRIFAFSVHKPIAIRLPFDCSDRRKSNHRGEPINRLALGPKWKHYINRFKWISIFLQIYLVIVQHNQFSSMISQVIRTTEYRLLLLLLRWRLHLCVTIAISIEIIGRRIICYYCRRRRQCNCFNHLASRRICVTIIVVRWLQCVWLWCCRIIVIIVIRQLFRIILQYVIGWIHKTGRNEALLAIASHDPKPFGIFSVQNCFFANCV